MRSARPAIAVACLLLVAGCTGTTGGPAASPSTTTTTASTTATTTTAVDGARTTDDGHYRRYEFTAERVDAAAIARERALAPAAVAERDQYADGRFAADLFGDGAAEYVDVLHADNVGEEPPGPLSDGAFVRANGSVYRVNATVLDRREARGFRVDAEWPGDPPADATVRDASALPRSDRRLLDLLRAGSLEGVASRSASAFWVFPGAAALNRSVLADGDVHFVRADGHVYRVSRDERVPAVRVRVRYELVRVADDPEAFARARLDRLVTPLNATGEPVRSVLEGAIAGGIEWEGTHDDVPRKYRDAGAWLHEHPPEGRSAYVRYRGAVYRVSLRKVLE